MKPEMKTAGLFASGTFVGMAAYSYWGTQDPIYAVVYAAVSAVLMGYLGYQIGKILGYPKGHLKPRLGKGAKNTSPDDPPRRPLSGEETLLGDLPGPRP